MESRKPQLGKSLAESHPDLALQAYGWDTTSLSAGSHKKLAWKCKFGHIWHAVVASRALSGSGCPVCVNQKILVGYNDLSTTNPELAAQADGWDPTAVSAGSHKKLSWICGHGHKWATSPDKRSGGQGCPYCAGKRVIVGQTDLVTTHPELATQADGWDPTAVSAGTHKKLNWKGRCGHKWNASVASRALNRSGCPFCANLKVLVGYNDLATTFPKVAAQADGWDPTTVVAGTNKKFDWKCAVGHKWTTSVQSRTLLGRGCHICSNHKLKVLAGFNDLKSKFPELAKEAFGWDPSLVRAFSSKKRMWKCRQGHTWEAIIRNRSRLGAGCPVCSNQKVLDGFNDLATTHPELAQQADGWDPKTVIAGTNKKYAWKCPSGHKWEAVVTSRAYNGNGCPICDNKKLLVGFNDLASTRPDLVWQAVGWDPRKVLVGSNSIKRWKCEFGHEWFTSVDKRMSGRGCPSCAKTGFDPNQPGFLYFIDHFDLNMFQIGITNFPDDRLNRHKLRGWEVIEIRGPMDGHLTQQLETSCLHTLENRGAILGHKAGIKQFDGYTEAWTKQSLNVTNIKQILDWVYEDEGNSAEKTKL